MVKKWPRVTLVHAPTIAALWLSDAQFVNRWVLYILQYLFFNYYYIYEGDVCDGYNSIYILLNKLVV